MAAPSVRTERGITVVDPVVDPGAGTELSASRADEFRRAAEPVAAGGGRVVVDLSRLRFLDSSGLGALVHLHRICSRAGGDLRLAGPTRVVRTVFELVRAHRLFEIYDSLDEAVASFEDEEG